MIIQERYDRMDILTYGSEREEAGGINMLVNLVRENAISVEKAAEKANMTVKDFTDTYLTPASA